MLKQNSFYDYAPDFFRKLQNIPLIFLNTLNDLQKFKAHSIVMSN